MNHCHFCRGELVEQLTTFIHEENGQFRVVRHVPARVCSRCGEKEFTPQVTGQILALLKQAPHSDEVLHVLAYDMTTAG